MQYPLTKFPLAHAIYSALHDTEVVTNAIGKPIKFTLSRIQAEKVFKDCLNIEWSTTSFNNESIIFEWRCEAKEKIYATLDTKNFKLTIYLY